MSALIKNILIVAVVAGVGFVGYNYLSRDPAGDTLVTVSGDGTSQMGAQVLSALNQLQQLKLDESVFSDKTFKSLKDFSRPLPTESVGRLNPFAPIGVEVSKSVTETVSTTTPPVRQTKATAPKAAPKAVPDPVSEPDPTLVPDPTQGF